MDEIMVGKVTMSTSLRKVYFPKISEQAPTFNAVQKPINLLFVKIAYTDISALYLLEMQLESIQGTCRLSLKMGRGDS